MIKTAKILEQIGSNFIIMPCNTAHYFIDKIQRRVKIPVLNMIKETVNFISRNYPDVKKVGLLATTGTIKSKVYEKEFNKKGIKTINPKPEEQEFLVMESIYGKKGIKAKYKKYPRSLLKKAGNHLTKSGAELIICGCTEISMILDQKKLPYVLINPSEIIAKVAVATALFGGALVGRPLVGRPLVGRSLVGRSLVGSAVVRSAVVRSAVVGNAVVGNKLVGNAVVGNKLVKTNENLIINSISEEGI